jgi:hypothetical protein
MQDDGQVVVLRQSQLGFVKQLLTRHVQALHKAIKTDFTHSHQTRVAAVLMQLRVKRWQVGLSCLRRVHGVYAEGIHVTILMRQQAYCVEIGRLNRWNHTGKHFYRACSQAHRVAVCGKFLGVQMAMAVNPIHA